MKSNSNTITIEEVNKLNIQRITLTRLVNKYLIERVKSGLYVIKGSWEDEYFNDLCERVPLEYDITVKKNLFRIFKICFL